MTSDQRQRAATDEDMLRRLLDERMALRQMVMRLASVIATTRITNQPEWMDYMAEVTNEVLDYCFGGRARMVRHEDGFEFRSPGEDTPEPWPGAGAENGEC